MGNRGSDQGFADRPWRVLQGRRTGGLHLPRSYPCDDNFHPDRDELRRVSVCNRYGHDWNSSGSRAPHDQLLYCRPLQRKLREQQHLKLVHSRSGERLYLSWVVYVCLRKWIDKRKPDSNDDLYTHGHKLGGLGYIKSHGHGCRPKPPCHQLVCGESNEY